MIVKKGERLRIWHSRKGEFLALALLDFDTADLQFWPVAAAERVEAHPLGTQGAWEPGESVPCRADFVTRIEKVEDD